MKTSAKDILLGIAVGDALGVPFEFQSREAMKQNPAKDMIGYGTHNQAPGTWSDDTSLTLCLAQALVEPYNLAVISQNFIKWKKEAYWTARNDVFDIGLTTAASISQLEEILNQGNVSDLELLKYEGFESDNGNGSLMRILPLIYEIHGRDLVSQFEVVWNNSALTHKHIRAGMSCMIYLKFAEHILNGLDKINAYEVTQKDILDLWERINFSESEQAHFANIIPSRINDLNENKIKSGGYVIEALEASLWSFLKTSTYEEAVLKVINFGHDTDTCAAITGGIAGLYYGYENIPELWRAALARMEDIEALAKALDNKYQH